MTVITSYSIHYTKLYEVLLFITFAIAFSYFGKAFTPLPKASASERVRSTVRALPTFVLGSYNFV